MGTVYRTGRREEFTFFEETRNILDLSSTIDILKWISKNCFWIKTVNDFYHAIFTVTEATGLEDTGFFFDNIVVRSALFCPPIHTKESNHNWQFYVFQNRNNWQKYWDQKDLKRDLYLAFCGECGNPALECLNQTKAIPRPWLSSLCLQCKNMSLIFIQTEPAPGLNYLAVEDTKKNSEVIPVFGSHWHWDLNQSTCKCCN